MHTREADQACPANLHKICHRKLDQLNLARTLNDLTRPPGDHLEPLKPPREGQHSIRINKQYRICFRWTVDGPTEVEVVDYHDE